MTDNDKKLFKNSLRNLLSNKMFSLINISGLALGMTCGLLIMLWIKNETQMDKFHANNKSLFRLMENQYYEGNISTFDATPGIIAENIVKDIPEINPAFYDEQLKNIFQYYSIDPDEMEKELHHYAKLLLDENKVYEAWQVLLAGI